MKDKNYEHMKSSGKIWNIIYLYNFSTTRDATCDQQIDFADHSHDYEPNWTLFSPFIIIYHHVVFLKLELMAHEVI